MSRRHLPSAPLLRQIELRGGPAACGVRQNSREQKALERAQRHGWLTVRAADELAVRLLGELPCELWGQDYWTMDDACEPWRPESWSEHLAARQIDCPECGAAASEFCVTADGRRMKGYTHTARRRQLAQAA